MTQSSQSIRTVTAYCSSSSTLAPEYTEVAERFGRGLAESGRSLVYGGGSVGLMGAVAGACRGAGGRVVGVITERLRNAELMDPDNDENIVVSTMRERKLILEREGDAFVVLPGGVGTLEEFFEILVGRLLGEHDKPIFIVNAIDPHHPEEVGYYQPLLDMFEHMIDSGFAKPGVRDLFHICREPEEAMEAISNGAPESSGDAAPRTDLMPGRAPVRSQTRSSPSGAQ